MPRGLFNQFYRKKLVLISGLLAHLCERFSADLKNFEHIHILLQNVEQKLFSFEYSFTPTQTLGHILGHWGVKGRNMVNFPRS